MASHNYGPMLINGGEVHNGDKVSVVQNNIEKAFFLTDQDHVDVGELVTKLSSAVQQYDTLRYYLESFGPRHKDLVSLLNDIQDLQSTISSLQTIIEDPELEDLSLSDDCLHPILEVSQSLDEYQSFIEEFRTNLELSVSDEVPNDRRKIQLSLSHDEIRWKLNHLRDKLNNTIIVANIHAQRRLQIQSMQQIHELKTLLALVKTDSERRLLPSLPPRLPLKRGDLERARLNHDPEFTLRRYLEALALQRPGISHPSTPSMQGSSIAPSSTTGIISFVTARERQSLSGINEDTYSSTFQIFIMGLSQKFESFVLQVDRDDTFRTVKSKIRRKVNFVADYSLCHHNRLLYDDSMISDNSIHSLDALNIITRVRINPGVAITTPTGGPITYLGSITLVEYKDLLRVCVIQDLREIHDLLGHKETRKGPIWNVGVLGSFVFCTATEWLPLLLQLLYVRENRPGSLCYARPQASRDFCTGRIRLFESRNKLFTMVEVDGMAIIMSLVWQRIKATAQQQLRPRMMSRAYSNFSMVDATDD